MDRQTLPDPFGLLTATTGLKILSVPLAAF
jgi:hypothetical protein